MRYSIRFDGALRRWLVVDAFTAESTGIHPTLAAARRQAEAQESRWLAYKAHYADMARSTCLAALEFSVELATAGALNPIPPAPTPAMDRR